MPQTIFPILRYEDARAAIDWLCKAFGFSVLFSVPETGKSVRHAQLRLGTNVIMLGSVRPDDPIQSPRGLGGASQALCVYIEDIDEHYRRSRAEGAVITHPLDDTDFGTREYHAKDLEEHLWVFGTYRPDVEPAG